MSKQTFPERLAQRRGWARLSQRELADALGVSLSVVCKWEQGRRVPNATDANKLSDVLSCSPRDLNLPDETIVAAWLERATAKRRAALLGWLEAH